MKTIKNILNIGTFKNRNGAISWRIHGYFNGDRIRKNFKTREEALAEKNTLAIQLMQIDSGMRPTVTILSESQLREAELLFEKVKHSPRPLSFYVDYALSNYEEPEQQKSLKDAIASYQQERTDDMGKGVISSRQLATIRYDLGQLNEYFHRDLVSDLTPPKLKTFLARGKVSLKTFNNRRGIISTFLKYAFDNGWIIRNPILKIPQYRISHKRGTAKTLTIEQSAKLMAYVEQYKDGRMVPFFALCLFAGIRPDFYVGEISKLKPSDINQEIGVIHIEPEVSKVNMKRRIAIQPNLAAWLEAYPLDKYPILDRNIKRLKTAISKKFGLSHDILRHTFISMHVAKFRSMGDTALQAGNSEEIIRKHYLDVKSPAEAEAFFNILPLRSPPLRELPPDDTGAKVWNLQQSNQQLCKHSPTLLVCA